MIQEFEGTKVPVHIVNGIPVLTTKDIANALGVSSNAIANTYRRYKEEFDEEDSFLSQIVTRSEKNRNMRLFSKTGIVLLSMFIKSPKAKAFRTWAKKTLSRILDGTYEVRDTKTGTKINVLAELLEMQARINYPDAAERIREAYGEELPPPPSREDFANVIKKEGIQFGEGWLLELQTLPTAKRVVRVAPGIGPTKKRRKARRRM